MSALPGLQGTRLGDYELLEIIGEGGMAAVYRAKQSTAFGREVALKVIRAEFTGDEPFQRRFLREAQAISRLSHPNILPLIEFGEEQGRLYLVMPLVREGTLRDLLSQHNGPLSLEEALPLFVPLCDAVHYAHQEDIIHRDIKPQNVLLQRHTHVLLADFGIAHNRFDTKLTMTGMGIGSVEYMAPEQADGRADVRSDIYSLGILLYQLLTGVVPYSGTGPLQVLLKKANEPLPDPRGRNPNLPAEVVDILQVALARDPNERFSNAGALGSAVQEMTSRALRSPKKHPLLWRPNPAAFAPQPAGAAPTAPLHRGPSFHVDLAPTLRRPGPSPSPRGDRQPTAERWPAVMWSDEGRWSNPPTWDTRRILPPSEVNTPAQSSRRSHALLVASLVVVLLLIVAVSSIAYGHGDLAWLHPGSAATGAQLLTPTPTMPVQPPQMPGAGGTPFPWPTPPPQPTSITTPQPTDTATPQPTASGTPGPAGTPTPQPSTMPTAQPTVPATPPPTGTPGAGPTATPTSQPTATP